jgi:exopolysaccharide production protein ExoZ
VKNNSPLLDSIQILRAIAALMILFAHLWSMLGPFGVQDAVPTFNFGASGVDLFFSISGFIMVYTSGSLFCQRGATWKFLIRRIIRIVPLYWILTTAVLFQYHRFLIPQYYSELNVILSYFFVPSSNGNGIPVPLLSAGWTLNYEMFFYVVFSLLIFLPRRAAVLAVTIIFIAIRNLAIPFGLPAWAPVQVWCDSIIYEFAFGMWIALAYCEGFRVPVWISATVAVFGVALMIEAYSGLFVTISRTAGWGGGTALILASIILADVNRGIPKFLWPLAAIGDASYALYLFHGFAPQMLYETNATTKINPVAHPYVYCAALVVTSLAGAFALHYLFERSIVRLVKNERSSRLARKQIMDERRGVGAALAP